MPKPLHTYLENQADRVERVLSAQKAPGRVTGGTVGPRIMRFFLDPDPGVRYEKLHRLDTDLALALHVSSVHIDRSKEGVVLEFENPNPRPVSLLKLLPQVIVDEHGNPDRLPDTTALLGLTDDGTPLLAYLTSPKIAHLIITGQQDAGKSVLLRTIALSLALTHEPEELRLICVHPDGKTFEPFEGLPHLIRSPVQDLAEGVDVISSMTMMLDYRERHKEDAPRVVILIDDAENLVDHGDFVKHLLTLVRSGHDVGIHLLVASRRPSLDIPNMVEHFPLNLVGKVKNEAEARIATLRDGTDAHLLHGRGDFLAIGGGESEPLRFQAAYVGEAEIRQEVAKLQHPTEPSVFLEPDPMGMDAKLDPVPI